jgi:hypothetical protein
MKRLIKWVLLNYGTQKATRFVDHLKTLGFHAATTAGISLGIEDLRIPPIKAIFLQNAENDILDNDLRYQRGQITAVEKLEKALDIWNTTNDTLKNEVIDHFRQTDIFNPVYMMAFSGARGNISQVRQLVGMRGLMADQQGQILDFPIRRNFREGLTVTEYMISCYGARKGLVDTALRTANSGYLTRRLVDVAQSVIIQQLNCETTEGLEVIPSPKHGGADLIGRVLCQPVVNERTGKYVARKNTEISPALAAELALFPKVVVRSPLTCRLNAVCQYCYGWDLSKQKLVQLGEAVGVLAAQSIGEPGTQLTMRTFHTGGVFAGEATEKVYAPYAGIIHYSHLPRGRKVISRYGEPAFLTVAPVALQITRMTHRGDEECANPSIILRFPAFTLLFVCPGQRVLFQQSLAELSRVEPKTEVPTLTKDVTVGEKELLAPAPGQVYFDNVKFYVKESKLKKSRGKPMPKPILKYPRKDVFGYGFIWILAGHLLRYNRSHKGDRFTRTFQLLAFETTPAILKPNGKRLTSQTNSLIGPVSGVDDSCMYTYIHARLIPAPTYTNPLVSSHYESVASRLLLRHNHLRVTQATPSATMQQSFLRQQHGLAQMDVMCKFAAPLYSKNKKIFAHLNRSVRLQTTVMKIEPGLQPVDMSSSFIPYPRLPRLVALNVRVRGSVGHSGLEQSLQVSDTATVRKYQTNKVTKRLATFQTVTESRFIKIWLYPRKNLSCALSDLFQPIAEGPPTKWYGRENVIPGPTQPWEKSEKYDFKGIIIRRDSTKRGGPPPYPNALYNPKSVRLSQSNFNGLPRSSAVFQLSSTTAASTPIASWDWRTSKLIHEQPLPKRYFASQATQTLARQCIGLIVVFREALTTLLSSYARTPLDANYAVQLQTSYREWSTVCQLIPDMPMHTFYTCAETLWQVLRGCTLFAEGLPWRQKTLYKLCRLPPFQHVLTDGDFSSQPNLSQYAMPAHWYSHHGVFTPATSPFIYQKEAEIRLPEQLALTKDSQHALDREPRLEYSSHPKQWILGQFVRIGDAVAQGKRSPYAGQVIRLTATHTIIRRVYPYAVSHGSSLFVEHGEFIQKDRPFATLVSLESNAGDIVQGLPKVDELLEAREPVHKMLTSVHAQLATLFLFYSKTYGVREGCRRSLQKIRRVLVEEVQAVYGSQGVFIADKHIEIIVRQMTTNVLIIDPGQTGLLPGDIVDLRRVEHLETKGVLASVQYRPILLGITRASLAAESFIAAASFQETKRVLTRAAVEGRIDWLTGLKENVILGRLIPAGTGFH